MMIKSLLSRSSPHLPGPDLMTARAEAVDDDLGRQRDVEVGRGDGGGIEVVQHLRCLVIASVIKVLYFTTSSFGTLDYLKV